MRIVVASGICVEHDAISNSMIEQARLLAGLDGVDDVALVAQHIDRDCQMTTEATYDPWQFVRSPLVTAADLVILHWGIAYSLFEALPLLTSDCRAVVHFHNQTPAHLVSDAERPKTQQGLEQIQLIPLTDARVWTESQHNIETLVDLGVSRERIVFMPLPIEPPRTLARVPRGPELRLLTVGRFVKAKGCDVLIDAVSQAASRSRRPIQLVMAGNLDLSDPKFFEELEANVVDLGLSGRVSFRVGPSDDELWKLYEWADVVVSPSLHEGLCVPIIEGYLAGCRAVGTDAGNLPHVIQPPDAIVPAGDATALASALLDLADAPSLDPIDTRALVQAYSPASTRAQLQRELRLSPSFTEGRDDPAVSQRRDR